MALDPPKLTASVTEATLPACHLMLSRSQRGGCLAFTNCVTSLQARLLLLRPIAIAQYHCAAAS